MLIFGEEKRKRKPLSKVEQYALKKVTGSKCVICGITEKEAGKLVWAHIKPHPKGGTLTLPMCRNCHGKHDDGLLTAREWKKLYATKEDYQRNIPKKPKKKKDWW
jgi:hypothetical protein